MPYEPPSTIEDIPKKYRSKLAEAMNERAVLGYAFSWKRMLRMLQELGVQDDTAGTLILNCIAAFREEDIKRLRDDLNETILAEFKSADVKTLRYQDPLGRRKDFMQMEGTTPSRFNKQTAMDLLVSKLKIQAKKVAEVWSEATEPGKKFTSLQCRDVKEGKEEE